MNRAIPTSAAGASSSAAPPPRRCSRAPGCAYMTPKPTAGGDQAGRAEDRRRPRLLQLGRLRAPKVFKGFQKEYGVKVIQSNFDSMESMQAKLAAGNRYDIIFPSAQWVQKLVAANQSAHDRPVDAGERAADLRPLRLLRRPLVRPESRRTRSRSRCTRPGSPGARTSSARPLTGSWDGPVERGRRAARTFLLDDRDEVLGMAALLLGYDAQHRATRTSSTAIVDKFAHPAAVPARLQQRRLQQPARRRRLDAPDLERRHGRAAVAGGGPVDLRVRGADARARRSTPTPTRSRSTPSTPAPHCCSSTTCCGRRTSRRTSATSATRCRCTAPRTSTRRSSRDYPACKVTVDDLSRDLYFTNDSVAKTQARDAAYTEMKVGV